MTCLRHRKKPSVFRAKGVGERVVGDEGRENRETGRVDLCQPLGGRGLTH